MSDERAHAIEEGQRHYERGRRLSEEGLLDEAARALEQSVKLMPTASVAWFDLALVYKWQHRWPECLRANQRVLERDPTEAAAQWNLGIAATALGEWAVARKAWRGYGVDVGDGEGPLELNLGMAPVRLNPETSGEVVWGPRIDPARVVVQNVPLPDSGYRWGDVVLHDGEPVGERMWEGHTYDVFNVLERLTRSDVPTCQVSALAPTPDDAAALETLFGEAHLSAEDWTGRVRLLCRRCSEGSTHEHPSPRDDGWTPERLFGLAAPPERAQRLLDEWADAAHGRAWDDLSEVA